MSEHHSVRYESSNDDLSVCIVGRSSSHFTRIVRIVAEAHAVPYRFQVVPNLLAPEAEAYGGNPGLRLPNLLTKQGTLFGALNSSRFLAALAPLPQPMVWPEHLLGRVAANALELTLQAMSSEVSLIMLTATGSEGSAYAQKLRTALEGILAWLDEHLPAALAELPLRDLSYLEVALFCLIDHLEFREVLSLEPYRSLLAFRDEFQRRPAAAATPYRFDG